MKVRLLLGVTTLTAFVTAPLFGCGDSGSNQGTGGSAGASSSSSGGGGGSAVEEPPDYEAAFPQDKVPRLDITITPENWKLMVDDMTAMLGEFGAGMGMGGPGGPGGPGGMGPPPELITACEGLATGDACMATLNGMPLTGTCQTAPDGTTFFCMPSGGMGGPGGPGGGSSDLIPNTPIYVECDVASETREWKHVGIRLKGNSSLAMPWMQGVWKLPLRLTFDKYEDTYPETENQRFYGFKALSLSNGANDNSLLRDKIGTEVFVNAGLPAPATAFFRVFIDHGDGPTYFGLYTGIELPSDDSFLEKHFGSDKGNLYKPDGPGATWATWVPEDIEKENNEDAADFSDAQALFDALHADRADAAKWRAGLEASLDVDGFLHWLALNTVVEDWDTYGRMSHNYYLYANPKNDSRFTWIPWDHSFAFMSGQSASISLSEITEQWPLIRYLLDDPTYLEIYKGYVAQAAAKEYTPAWAEPRFQAAHDLIAPYVTGAEGEKTGYTFLSAPAAFDDELQGLLAHVKARQADVATYLGP